MNVNNTEKTAAQATKEQSLQLVNRKSLTLTGISDVISFDETLVNLSCADAVMSVEGEGMRVVRMDVDSGELTLEGKINAVSYVDRRPHKSGLFGKK